MLESLSELFHGFCVQAMLLLCSRCTAIKMRVMDTKKWVDKHPVSALTAASIWSPCGASGGKGLLVYLSLQQLNGLHLELEVSLDVF